MSALWCIWYPNFLEKMAAREANAVTRMFCFLEIVIAVENVISFILVCLGKIENMNYMHFYL